MHVKRDEEGPTVGADGEDQEQKNTDGTAESALLWPRGGA